MRFLAIGDLQVRPAAVAEGPAAIVQVCAGTRNRRADRRQRSSRSEPRQRGAPQRHAYAARSLPRDAAVDRQPVIVGELVAAGIVRRAVDEHAAVVVLERIAVGGARVVDPARRVAAAPAVDHRAVARLEDERVMRIRGIAVRTLVDDLPRRALAAVFDDHAPLRIVVAAKTPRPWMPDLRTRYRRGGVRWEGRRGSCGEDACSRMRPARTRRQTRPVRDAARREPRSAPRRIAGAGPGGRGSGTRRGPWRASARPGHACRRSGQRREIGNQREERRRARQTPVARPPASGRTRRAERPADVRIAARSRAGAVAAESLADPVRDRLAQRRRLAIGRVGEAAIRCREPVNRRSAASGVR